MSQGGRRSTPEALCPRPAAPCSPPSQAAGGDPEDPSNQRSAWYSNPAASHTQAAVRSGVGKYIKDAKLGGGGAAGGGGVGGHALAAAATAGGAGGARGQPQGGSEPASKKPKLQTFGNFDSW